MPGLRYGRDITDDAAQLQRLITDNLARSRNAELSPEDRARAREIALNSLETVRAVFGNMRTLRLFASEAGQGSTGTYTSEGRQAAGLNGTVPVKGPLSKAAHAAYKRLEARGVVGGMQAFDPNDPKSPTRYMPGNMRLAERAGRQVSPRMARGRAAAADRGFTQIAEEGERLGGRRGGPSVNVSRAIRRGERGAESLENAANRTRKRSAQRAAQRARKAAAPKSPRGGSSR
jgi:hypothetical protein